MTVSADSAVCVAGAVDKRPAPSDKLRKMQSHEKTAVEHMVSAPRLVCKYKLFLAVGNAVVIRCHRRLVFAKRHAVKISEISKMCSFTTPSDMIAKFREHYGTTPAQFRKELFSENK